MKMKLTLTDIDTAYARVNDIPNAPVSLYVRLDEAGYLFSVSKCVARWEKRHEGDLRWQRRMARRCGRRARLLLSGVHRSLAYMAATQGA